MTHWRDMMEGPGGSELTYRTVSGRSAASAIYSTTATMDAILETRRQTFTTADGGEVIVETVVQTEVELDEGDQIQIGSAWQTVRAVRGQKDLVTGVTLYEVGLG